MPVPIPPELVELGARTMFPGDILTFYDSDENPILAVVYEVPLIAKQGIQVRTYINPRAELTYLGIPHE